jgi:hypothetical protein
MWFLRRKSSVPETRAKALPPDAGPVRRVEITVERRWVTRQPGSRPAECAEVPGERDPGMPLPMPPDG